MRRGSKLRLEVSLVAENESSLRRSTKRFWTNLGKFGKLLKQMSRALAKSPNVFKSSSRT